MNNSYKYKYSKYKKKYLMLKYNNYNLIGGATFNAFNKTAKFFITAYLGGNAYVKNKYMIDNFCNKLNLPLIQTTRHLHITLMQFDININSPFYEFMMEFMNNNCESLLNTIIDNIILNDADLIAQLTNQGILVTQEQNNNLLFKLFNNLKLNKSEYALFNRYFVEKYTIDKNNEQIILKFWASIINYLNNEYIKYKDNKVTISFEEKDIQDNKKNETLKYKIYKDSEDNFLYGIPIRYYDLKSWIPHISLFNITSELNSIIHPITKNIIIKDKSYLLDDIVSILESTNDKQLDNTISGQDICEFRFSMLARESNLQGKPMTKGKELSLEAIKVIKTENPEAENFEITGVYLYK